jgi:hypothetical protein
MPAPKHNHLNCLKCVISSASARISKGQGCLLNMLKEKGREHFWPKKGQFASYKEKLEKRTEFHSF